MAKEDPNETKGQNYSEGTVQQFDISNPGDSLIVDSLGGFKINFHDVYKVDERLNEGSFGVVYKAHHRSTESSGGGGGDDDKGRSFAVKVVKRRRRNRDYKKRFLYEASILRDLINVPNIIQLIDVYVDDQEMFMVQELAKGGDVFDRLVQRETYTENDARDLARILLRTINNLHSHKIVHRDLKPENLLLREENEDTSISICDFGSAKYLPDDEKEGLSTYCGTAAFTAPEILEGLEYREKVDMWSIGCILFMLLGGYLPFGDDFYGLDGDDEALYERILIGQVVFDEAYWDVISPEAEQLIMGLLAVDPNGRLTATEALDCEWFVKTSDELEESDLIKSRNGIIHYCSTRRTFKDSLREIRTSTMASTATATNRSSNSWNSKSVLDDLKSQSSSSSDKVMHNEKLWKSSNDSLDYQRIDSYNSNAWKTDILSFAETLQEFDEESSSPYSSSKVNQSDFLLFSEKLKESQKIHDDGNDASHNVETEMEQNHDDANRINEFYTLKQLQDMSVPGLDYKNREQYLSDMDFENVFHAPREEVQSWKAWKVTRCKRQHHLW